MTFQNSSPDKSYLSWIEPLLAKRALKYISAKVWTIEKIPQNVGAMLIIVKILQSIKDDNELVVGNNDLSLYKYAKYDLTIFPYDVFDKHCWIR